MCSSWFYTFEFLPIITRWEYRTLHWPITIMDLLNVNNDSADDDTTKDRADVKEATEVCVATVCHLFG